MTHECCAFIAPTRRSHGEASIKTGASPQFVRVANGKLYVYSVVDGLLQEITPSPFAVARELHLPPFASDLETDPTAAYVTYPKEGVIHVVELATMTDLGKVRVGGTPVDVAFIGDDGCSEWVRWTGRVPWMRPEEVDPEVLVN